MCSESNGAPMTEPTPAEAAPAELAWDLDAALRRWLTAELPGLLEDDELVGRALSGFDDCVPGVVGVRGVGEPSGTPTGFGPAEWVVVDAAARVLVDGDLHFAPDETTLDDILAFVTGSADSDEARRLRDDLDYGIHHQLIAEPLDVRAWIAFDRADGTHRRSLLYEAHGAGGGGRLIMEPDVATWLAARLG